jgi:hypothetical protein
MEAEGPAPGRHRVRTGRGVRAAQPQGRYEPQARVAGGLVVEFHGEDGRSKSYDFGRLPCPQLLPDLAAAFAHRVGPTGQRRTVASAETFFAAARRLVKFLDSLPEPPAGIEAIRLRDLQLYRLHRLQTVKPLGLSTEITDVGRLLTSPNLAGRLDPELADAFATGGLSMPPGTHGKGGRPGFSDREFAAIVSAARGDAVAIRARIGAGEQLVADYARDPGAMSGPDRKLAARLADMAATGRVPSAGRREAVGGMREATMAGHLFVKEPDLPPLVILAAALSGRNGETVKELTAEHRLVEDKAVAVELVKRRRGKAMGRGSVHWEVGADSRRLHTSGGFYLLLEELMRRSRGFSGSERVWSIWTRRGGPADAGLRQLKADTGGHVDPFALRLGRVMSLNRWAARHGLVGDDGGPLEITLNRIKTTVEVRNARLYGGHLPSASRTNTFDVSFLHYLRNDPVVRQWADEVLTAALEHAESTARNFLPHVLDAAGRQAFAEAPQAVADVVGSDAATVGKAIAGDLDTLVAACLDAEHHPWGEGHCQVSFLTCLRCPNALVTERHLPMLLALADWLQDELDRTSVADWCRRHGVTWLILTRLVLPRFTQAQCQAAAVDKPVLPIGLLELPAGQA